MAAAKFPAGCQKLIDLAEFFGESQVDILTKTPGDLPMAAARLLLCYDCRFN